MFNKKRSLPLTILILLIGSAAYLFYSAKNQSTANTVLIAKDAVPEIPCYPISKYKYPVKTRKFIYQNKTYFEVDSPSRTAPEIYILSFEVASKSCRQIGNITIASRKDYMPKTAAEYFAEQSIEEMFQACLRKKKSEPNVKQKCNEYIEGKVNIPGTLDGEHTNFLLLEDAEALNRRGIKTDKALIVRPKTGYSLTENGSENNEKTPTQALAKCIKVVSPEILKKISIVQVKVFNTIRLGKRQYYDIDVELEHNNTSRHVFQIIFSQDDYCQLYYVGSDIGVQPLSARYSKEYARSLILTWYKWKLKNVPGERVRIQQYLASPNPKLADEEYWTFSQLGFKMPKVYKKVPQQG